MKVYNTQYLLDNVTKEISSKYGESMVLSDKQVPFIFEKIKMHICFYLKLLNNNTDPQYVPTRKVFFTFSGKR